MAGLTLLAPVRQIARQELRRSPPPSTRCWSGIRSSSTRSLRRIRRTRRVSGSERSSIRRSSTPTTASNSDIHRFSFSESAPRGPRAEPRSSLPGTRRWWASSHPKNRRWMRSYEASLAALIATAKRRDRSDAVVREAIERGIEWGTEVRAGCARLARDRWFQRELSGVHRRDGCRPVAADTAGVRADERPGIGIHRHVRPGQQYPIPAWTAAESDEHRRTRPISMPSRRSVARPDRRARRTRRRSRRSGKGTPASIGIRQRTRLRAPTICPFPTATGFSRC